MKVRCNEFEKCQYRAVDFGHKEGDMNSDRWECPHVREHNEAPSCWCSCTKYVERDETRKDTSKCIPVQRGES